MRHFLANRHSDNQPIGEGLDFGRFKEPPPLPFGVADFRRLVSPLDALRVYARDRSGPEERSALRRKIGERLIEALRPASTSRLVRGGWQSSPLFDYAAARRTIKAEVRRLRSSRRPEAIGIHSELTGQVSIMLEAFEDPKAFISRRARSLAPFQSDIRRPSQLGELLWTFGFAALFHPAIRKAFDECSPEQLLFVLGIAEGKQSQREGRRRGRKKPAIGRRERGRPPKSIPSRDLTEKDQATLKRRRRRATEKTRK